MMRKLIYIIIYFILINISISYSNEVPFNQEDKERLIRLEATLKEFKDAVDKRFEQVDKRFEQVDKRFEQIDKRSEQIEKRFDQIDKRFEQVDKRFEQVDKRFGDLISFLWILATIFLGMTSITIGFALWDRRTMIRPFEKKVKDMEAEIFKNKDTLHKFVEALVNLSERDEKVREILEQMKLL